MHVAQALLAPESILKGLPLLQAQTSWAGNLHNFQSTLPQCLASRAGGVDCAYSDLHRFLLSCATTAIIRCRQSTIFLYNTSELQASRTYNAACVAGRCNRSCRCRVKLYIAGCSAVQHHVSHMHDVAAHTRTSRYPVLPERTCCLQVCTSSCQCCSFRATSLQVHSWGPGARNSLWTQPHQPSGTLHSIAVGLILVLCWQRARAKWVESVAAVPSNTCFCVALRAAVVGRHTVAQPPYRTSASDASCAAFRSEQRTEACGTCILAQRAHQIHPFAGHAGSPVAYEALPSCSACQCAASLLPQSAPELQGPLCCNQPVNSCANTSARWTRIRSVPEFRSMLRRTIVHRGCGHSRCQIAAWPVAM
jgi:hypothetical protein